MGGQDFDRTVEAAPMAAGQAMSAAAQAAMKRTSADDTTLPTNRLKDGKDAGLKISDAGVTPIVLAMDVTASRGDDSKIVYDKLPMFFGQMVQCDYCENPSISFCGIGDAPYDDKAPLQVCDFTKGTELDDWIKKLWLEEGGGGSGEESYELAAYYYGEYSEMPPGKKGLFFFTGDEHYYDTLRKIDVKKCLGPEVPSDISAKDIFNKLQEKFDVFMLYPQKDQAARQKDIQQELKKRLAREGAKSGEIAISLMWDTRDDLDLHVSPPGANEISYSNKNSAGGQLDVDMNAGGPVSDEPVENVFWPPLTPGVDGPPKGEYKVWIHNYTRRTSAATKWTVSITAGGAEPEVFQGSSSGEKERIDVKDFTYSGPVPKGNKAKKDDSNERGPGKGYDNESILHDWGLVIPQHHVLPFKTPKAIVDILLGVISIHTGSRTRSAYIKDLVERGQDEARQLEVDAVLKAWEQGVKEAKTSKMSQEVADLRKTNGVLQAELDALKESLKLPQRIFVRGFPPDTTSEDIRKKLAEAGSIVSCEVPERNDGTLKDYALVEFESPEEATKALDMFDGAEFGDGKLSVRRDRGSLPPTMLRARTQNWDKSRDSTKGKGKGKGKPARSATAAFGDIDRTTSKSKGKSKGKGKGKK